MQHVGDHHEHVIAGLEREELGLRERDARREQPFDRRVAGPVQVEDAALERRGLREAGEEAGGLALGDAEADEDHGEGLAAWRACPLDDARRQLERGQAGSREDRQLLAAHERVHAIDGGDAGLDEVGGRQAAYGIHRCATDLAHGFADRGRQVVERRARGDERLARDGDAERLRDQPDDRLVVAHRHRRRRRARIGDAEQLQICGNVQLVRGDVPEAGVAEIHHEIGPARANLVQEGRVIRGKGEGVAGNARERRLHRLVRGDVLVIVAAAALGRIGKRVVSGQHRDVADGLHL